MAIARIADYFDEQRRTAQPTASPAVPSAPAPTTTRDQAWTQYQDAYRNAGAGDLLSGDYAGEAQREFGDWWKNASADSGELQGSQYQNTWASLLPQLQQRIQGRIAERQQGVTQPDSNLGSTQQAISASQSGTGGMPSMAGTGQFDDPYTRQLEDLIKNQMSALYQPQANPGLDQLNQFLTKRFSELTESPGYSPEDLALIRTQMLEPIERDRAANRDRVLQRTASRGMLPSSGLHEQDLQEFVDRPAMEARTGAQRDIAINAINQRRGDLNQALSLGRLMGIDIPQLQRGNAQADRGEALNLSSLLYDLPNRAMQSAQSVITGSPGPQDLFSQAIQLQQAQQQQQALNAQKWAQIGQLIAGLF